MSGAALPVGRLVALGLLAAALALAGCISSAAASTGQETTRRPPTLLWKSYPLEQRPSTTEQLQALLGNQQAAPSRPPEPTRQAAPASSPEVQPPQDLLLVSALLATLAAMAAIVLMQTALPARVGGFRRARAGAQARGPARRPSDPRPPRRTPPPQRKVTGRPGDDLLEALHPKSPSAPEPEPAPEQPVVEEPRRAPAHEHEGARRVEQQRPAQPKPVEARNPLPERPEREPEQLEREVERLHGRTRTRPPSEPERQRDHEPWTLMHEVHAVPTPRRPADGGHPPQRRGARQTGASVETCEIRLWRGYVKCQLYATLRGSGEALATSRYFRLPENDAPNAGAQRALADLLAELERDGWTVVRDRPLWYQHKLQRLAP